MASRRFFATHLVFRLCAAIFLVVIAAGLIYTQDAPERVHSGDIVDVDVEGSFEFDWRGRLTPEGFLDGLLPFADPIPGLCRTEAEIAVDVEKALSKVLREPKATVRILDRSGRAIALIDGAIKSPQRFRIDRKVSLQELIVLAGGITDESSGEISIFRPASLACYGETPEKTNVPRILEVKVADLLTGVAAANPEIVSGDLVTVIKASPIYVIGGVINPRPVPSRGTIALSRLIATAGGLAKDSNGEITVYRRKGSESLMLPSKVNKETGVCEPDIEISPFDIVDVAQKGRERPTHAPVVVPTDVRPPGPLPLRIID